MNKAEPEGELRDRCGEIIAGRYRIEALLGRGGMGCVYRAQHLALDEPVVVKFIDPAYAQIHEARARFRREAKALIRMRHPGVVTMHELGEDAGGLFLVMELLQGHTLGDEMGRSTAPMPLARAFDIFLQLGSVLDAIHTAGVVHRDLKPDNVMLVPGPAPSSGGADRAVLMDFGLVRFHETADTKLSSTGAVMGTPAYMSAEQCAGTAVGPASDVYSLGMMLFEALAGRHPFAHETPVVVMSHHMFVPMPRLERLASGEPVPPGLVKLIEDMVAKKPEARPSAAELVSRLEEARTGKDPQSAAASSTARRVADASKSRSERGLPPMDSRGMASDPTLEVDVSSLQQPMVWLRGFSAERAGRLVASLAVNGIAGISGETLAMLGPADLRGTLRAVVLSGAADSHASEVLRAVRGIPECATTPVMIIDVPGTGEVAELIRAGASDVALAVVGDDAVMTKIWRLIKRKR